MSNNALATISEDVQVAREGFRAMGVSDAVFEREAGFAIQLLTAQKYTMDTALMNRQSVVNAVTNIAAMGLTLNPAKKQAYLVPRDGKICLDISYMGLLDIAIASGSIRWGQAEVVFEADTFALVGVDQPPKHERDPLAADRGEARGAYVVVKTPEGDYLTTAMPIGEINAIRDRSSAYKAKKGPWITDPGEMVKKTVIKRAYKLWPKTDRLDQAIHHLNTEAGEGIDFEPDPVDQPKNFGLTPPRAKIVRATANAMLQAFNEGNEYGAYEEWEAITENEEKQAIWSILRPHSALRTSIKAQKEEQQKRDAALAAMQPPPPTDPDMLVPVLQRSIAQAKEARA